MQIVTHRPLNTLQLLEGLLATGRSDAQRSIPMDFYETDSAYVVRASLPGFSKEQISVEIDGDLLTIRAKREESPMPEGFNALRVEGLPIERSRVVTMPEKLDSEGARATSRDGILELHLPKHAPTRHAVKID